MRFNDDEDDPGGWTPKTAGAVLVDAVRWARYSAGRTGPAGFRSTIPTYVPTILDRLAEGWGLPSAGEEPEPAKVLRRHHSPARIALFDDALHWPGRYVVPTMPTSAAILNVWLVSKVWKLNFGELVDRRTDVGRATAYRYRDKALGAIAQGLVRDGVRHDG